MCVCVDACVCRGQFAGVGCLFHCVKCLAFKMWALETECRPSDLHSGTPLTDPAPTLSTLKLTQIPVRALISTEAVTQAVVSSVKLWFCEGYGGSHLCAVCPNTQEAEAGG